LLRPRASRQTISPSITASCALTAYASSSQSCGQCLKVWPLRDTRSQWCPSMWASARKPSCFTSKSQSGWSNGSGRRRSGVGRSAGADCRRTRSGGVLGAGTSRSYPHPWPAPTQPHARNLRFGPVGAKLWSHLAQCTSAKDRRGRHRSSTVIYHGRVLHLLEKGAM
jgi:hypothetical protein